MFFIFFSFLTKGMFLILVGMSALRVKLINVFWTVHMTNSLYVYGQYRMREIC